MTAEIIVFPGNQRPGKLETSIPSMGNLVLMLKRKNYWERMNDNQRCLVQTAELLIKEGGDWNELTYYKALIQINHKRMGDTLLGRLTRLRVLFSMNFKGNQ